MVCIQECRQCLERKLIFLFLNCTLGILIIISRLMSFSSLSCCSRQGRVTPNLERTLFVEP